MGFGTDKSKERESGWWAGRGLENTLSDAVCAGAAVFQDSIVRDTEAQKDVHGHVDNGRRLFSMSCATCHNVNTESSGPALRGILDRAPSKQWIYDFIRNSTRVIQSGDQYANNLFKEFDGERMPHFPGFTDQELDDILTYIEAETKEE